MHSNISVGLDIGTTKIVAMVGTKNEYNKVEILRVGKSKSLGVHRGVVNNITQTIQSIQQAVEEAKTLSGEVLGPTLGATRALGGVPGGFGTSTHTYKSDMGA